MNLKFLLAFSYTLLALPGQTQQLTVNDVKSLQTKVQSGSFSGRAEWNALTYYLQGVMEGIGGYQEGLPQAGKTPLFCPPKGKSYSFEELMQILNQSSPNNHDRPASKVILETYIQRYPCQ